MKHLAKIHIFTAITLLALAVACSKPNPGEEAAADIEAAMMQGREDARKFVGKKWPDTIALQQQLLEARSHGSKYIIEGHHKAAAAYDSAFISTLRTVRPDVARHLRPAPASE